VAFWFFREGNAAFRVSGWIFLGEGCFDWGIIDIEYTGVMVAVPAVDQVVFSAAEGPGS
jgi:hypothetical protein